MTVAFRRVLARALGLYRRTAIALMTAGLVLALANVGAEALLRAYPQWVMSDSDRINENTRAVREKLIPADKAAEFYDLADAAEVGPLWAEYYAAQVEFESYTHFRFHPQLGRYMRVTEAGYRETRTPGPWPPDRAYYNVFFFGNSTAFGVGPAWATVASYLQEAMNTARPDGRLVRVYNFGRSGYISTQELILLQSLLRQGQVPDMAVFLDGLTDFCWPDGQPSGWRFLSNLFNARMERARAEAASYGSAASWDELGNFIASVPIVRLAHNAMTAPAAEPAPRYGDVPRVDEQPAAPGVLQAVIDRYLANLRQVEALAAGFGFRPVFVWQPIPTYKYDEQYHLFRPDRLYCHVNSKYGYPLMARRIAADPPGKTFVWAADMQETLREPLYIDAFHYTAPMARRLAAFIAGEIDRRGLRAPPMAQTAHSTAAATPLPDAN